MTEQREAVGGVRVFSHERPTPAASAPILYLHGVPTNADDFLPFLERTGGIAIDLPGFGRSDKRADFDHSIGGYASFLEQLVNEWGLDRFSLVMHDWGAVGLALAELVPVRVQRLVLIDAVPFLPGYRWHRIARIWRTRVLGELFMGLSTRWAFRRLGREGLAGEGPPPEELLDRVWEHFDHGTQRAILRLYRSAPPDALARAGERLGELQCPALVVWGEDDPYLPARFAHDYAAALGGPAQVEIVRGARHWPWLDSPELVGSICSFLLGESD